MSGLVSAQSQHSVSPAPAQGSGDDTLVAPQQHDSSAGGPILSQVIHRTFHNDNGLNELEIRVTNPYGGHNYPGGKPNSLTVRLSNGRYADTLVYDNPDYEMSLIALSEANIALRTVGDRTAVIIPFSYGGNADDDLQIGCAVLCDRRKYLFHIRLRGEEFQNYRIVDDLNVIFRELPRVWRRPLTEFIETEYEAIVKHSL